MRNYGRPGWHALVEIVAYGLFGACMVVGTFAILEGLRGADVHTRLLFKGASMLVVGVVVLRAVRDLLDRHR